MAVASIWQDGVSQSPLNHPPAMEITTFVARNESGVAGLQYSLPFNAAETFHGLRKGNADQKQ